ncbi:hypothetical protein DBV15_12223 [Temnothorax longispinosus]|uniref:Retrotransposon gag domain-containing protein n=1 Tax=Temnothorax longispinosus TaxID=300112 RepID=A0A4S2KAF5_9HYME|nr:hypothetical protein DBV15_12223 [Temnothorax longispinosus]
MDRAHELKLQSSSLLKNQVCASSTKSWYLSPQAGKAYSKVDVIMLSYNFPYASHESHFAFARMDNTVLDAIFALFTEAWTALRPRVELEMGTPSSALRVTQFISYQGLLLYLLTPKRITLVIPAISADSIGSSCKSGLKYKDPIIAIVSGKVVLTNIHHGLMSMTSVGICFVRTASATPSCAVFPVPRFGPEMQLKSFRVNETLEDNGTDAVVPAVDCETRGVKAKKAEGENYGDPAVGYVELRREKSLCHIRGKVCPEHRVNNKAYVVSMLVNEETERVEYIRCEDCEVSEALDDVLRAAGREGESTEALLIRLLARTLLNEPTGNDVPRNEVPLYHVIPDLSKNIENFMGDGKSVRPINWINNIESMQKIHQWPENFTLETARMLRGGARDWYRARALTLVSWEAFKTAFKNTFVVAESTSDRWQKMIDRVQQKDESLSAYFHAKTKLCIDLKLNFRDIKEQVLDGLWSKKLCIFLMARNHHSLDDLLHDIMANEQVLTQRATRIRAKKDPVKPKTQGQPPYQFLLRDTTNVEYAVMAIEEGKKTE